LFDGQNLSDIDDEYKYPFIFDESGSNGEIPVISYPKVEATQFLGFAPDVTIGKRKFRPHLSQKPLTFKGSFDQSLPASLSLVYDVHKAAPDITIEGEGKTWTPLPDLLHSKEFDNNFAVELDDDGTAFIRFPNLVSLAFELETAPLGPGKRIDSSVRTPFYATYRIGNGIRGNVGSESISRIVLDGVEGSIFNRIRNPLSAIGGMEAEDKMLAKHYAPEAFKTQQRAVTPDDYVEVLKRNPDIQKAFSIIRWTGSWYTVFVGIDRVGGKVVDDQFIDEIRNYLNYYRLAGYDVEIKGPIFVPLDIQVKICIKPNYYPSDVVKKLLEVFGSKDNPDGSRGFFHADNFSFGQPVILSRVYERLMNVDGISFCSIVRFQRWGKNPNGEIKRGMIEMDYYEIARLDNDANFQENGKIEFTFDNNIGIPVEEIK